MCMNRPQSAHIYIICAERLPRQYRVITMRPFCSARCKTRVRGRTGAPARVHPRALPQSAHILGILRAAQRRGRSRAAAVRRTYLTFQHAKFKVFPGCRRTFAGLGCALRSGIRAAAAHDLRGARPARHAPRHAMQWNYMHFSRAAQPPRARETAPFCGPPMLIDRPIPAADSTPYALSRSLSASCAARPSRSRPAARAPCA